jgi:proton-dependent oligopeptide transporter, POT family
LSSTFFGHPLGLATLFFTEMWERFTYYGMRAVLVLFLVAAVSSGGLGLDDKTATAIYGLYTAGVYLAALPGGWIADRLIGARRAVLIGGIVIALGNTLLAVTATPKGFYFGLATIVAGVGLLKPNASVMVADLYPEGGARRDAGFTVYYMGINLGAMLGPFAIAESQEILGARAGFGAAAVGMVLGVVQYVFMQRNLGDAGMLNAPAEARPKPWGLLWGSLLAAGLMATALWFGWLAIDPLSIAHLATYLIAATAAVFFAWVFLAAKLSPEERRQAFAILVLFVGSTLFWSGYEQAGSSLNLFAERYTDRALQWLHFLVPNGVIPAAWFQSLEPIYVIVFAPVAAWVWLALARRQLNPSAPAKFAIGVLLMGAGFLVMAAAAEIVAHGSKVLPFWLIFTYLLHTFGELCLSPVGLSYLTKLSPKRLVGQMMGMWFLSLSLGNLAAGLFAGEIDVNNLAGMPGQYMHMVYFALALGGALLILIRPVKKLMGSVQ